MQPVKPPKFHDCPQNFWCGFRKDKEVCTCLQETKAPSPQS